MYDLRDDDVLAARDSVFLNLEIEGDFKVVIDSYYNNKKKEQQFT